LRDDRLQPRLGIFDVGGNRADHAEHLIVGSVLPSSRNEIGTAAVIDFAGSAPRSTDSA
jgi:hypothetical protein